MSDTGRITAYAEVTDGKSGDTMFIPPVRLDRLGATNYVVAGVADVDTWRSDLRTAAHAV